MKRRDFLSTTAMATTALLAGNSASSTEEPIRVMTVQGWLNASELGSTLSHEHVMCDFIGADQVSPDRYDADEVVEVVLPYLEQVKTLGCQSFIDCTPAYIGRDARVIKRLSERSGLHMMTNTGYYGAAGDKFVPQHAYDESAEQLAARWIDEWENGIDGSDIKPGYMKIGVDSGALSDIDKKLVVAAALVHLETGLTIASHTGNGGVGLEQLDVLEERGVSPTAFVWVHAQNERNMDALKEGADRGAWISFDAVSPSNTPRHLAAAKALYEHGVFDRLLISHDAGWYSVGEEGGGSFRHYNDVYRRFLPALQREGISTDETTALMETHPAEAFAVRIRKA